MKFTKHEPAWVDAGQPGGRERTNIITASDLNRWEDGILEANDTAGQAQSAARSASQTADAAAENASSAAAQAGQAAYEASAAQSTAQAAASKAENAQSTAQAANGTATRAQTAAEQAAQAAQAAAAKAGSAGQPTEIAENTRLQLEEIRKKIDKNTQEIERIDRAEDYVYHLLDDRIDDLDSKKANKTALETVKRQAETALETATRAETKADQALKQATPPPPTASPTLPGIPTVTAKKYTVKDHPDDKILLITTKYETTTLYQMHVTITKAIKIENRYIENVDFPIPYPVNAPTPVYSVATYSNREYWYGTRAILDPSGHIGIQPCQVWGKNTFTFTWWE